MILPDDVSKFSQSLLNDFLSILFRAEVPHQALSYLCLGSMVNESGCQVLLPCLYWGSYHLDYAPIMVLQKDSLNC